MESKPKYKLKVYKLNSDVPTKIKDQLLKLSGEKGFNTLSAFMASELRSYLLTEDLSDKLPKDILMYYDTLPGITTNNLTFYIPLSLKDKFARIAKENMRPLKLQAKHFAYFIHYKYNQHQ